MQALTASSRRPDEPRGVSRAELRRAYTEAPKRPEERKKVGEVCPQIA
jgi:hypothetical protein